MSLENARAFIRRLQRDKDFRAKVQEADNNDRNALVRNAGFSFSSNDLSSAMREISDRDLKSITGGRRESPCAWNCFFDTCFAVS
jgi:predicted ribosomally synthesized peptide with nif11-like leader